MKNNSKLLNIFILLLLNLVLIFIEYFFCNDFIMMITDSYYLYPLLYLFNGLIINPLLSYFIYYYLIFKRA